MDQFWKSKKVLITGHSGFKGSWLSLILKIYGADIYGISLQPELNPNLYELIQDKLSFSSKESFLDIRDRQKLSKKVNEYEPDIVFHMAAQPLVRRSYLDPIETWETNLMGTLNLLNALKNIKKKCSVVIITTDKVYKNRNVEYGYRESDELGGNDPYSSSKAACELAVYSWRKSFCESDNKLNKLLSIATARSGNVIGGGDWSIDRIVPDTIKAFKEEKILKIRNSKHTRPWQHVLDPLSGYMMLAMHNFISEASYNEAFNFGPKIESNTTVIRLVKEIIKHWPGEFSEEAQKDSYYEAEMLHLQIDKSYKLLNWYPKWGFEESVQRTAKWYKDFYENNSAYECMLNDIKTFFKI